MEVAIGATLSTRRISGGRRNILETLAKTANYPIVKETQ
jgi:hypothetical protein